MTNGCELNAIADWTRWPWHPAGISEESAAHLLGPKCDSILRRSLKGRISYEDRDFLLERIAEDHLQAIKLLPAEIDREVIAEGYIGLAFLAVAWAEPSEWRARRKDEVADAKAHARILANEAWSADLRLQIDERRARRERADMFAAQAEDARRVA